MFNVLIFGGTTEGRILSERLSKSGIFCDTHVATEYGSQVMNENDFLKIHEGRLGFEDICKLMDNKHYDAVVDATHPYAAEVSVNIARAVSDRGVAFYRLERSSQFDSLCAKNDNCFYFESAKECQLALKQEKGNILLTTGSKELDIYCSDEEIRKRLFVRILPGMESLEKCYAEGLDGRQIIAMQGPFNVELNEAVIKQYGIEILVTKESGVAGGYKEKLEAAANCGIKTFIIKRPENSLKVEKMSLEDVCLRIEEMTGVSVVSGYKNANVSGMNITIAGVGMGSAGSMTADVKNAIAKAKCIFGAKRLVDGIDSGSKVYPYYTADEIISCIRENGEECGDIVILVSGDSGFYSATEKLKRKLKEKFSCNINILPGISSLSFLAAKTGVSWQDAVILSTHGISKEEWLSKLVWNINHKNKVFFLTSSYADVNDVSELIDRKYKTIYVGYQLSYENETIYKFGQDDKVELHTDGLYSVIVVNEKPEPERLSPGLADESFIRDKVPMTKEEVRAVSICKLKLNDNAVVYDIGSGTGSVAVEVALLSPNVKVYAVENNEAAVSLIEANKAKFQAYNIDVIKGMAPDVLEDIEAPTHVFIGGTKGRLDDILDALCKKGKGIKIVINAVSLETVGNVMETIKHYDVDNLDITEISVSKTRSVGAYNMLEGRNPVFIFAFELCERRG